MKKGTGEAITQGDDNDSSLEYDGMSGTSINSEECTRQPFTQGKEALATIHTKKKETHAENLLTHSSCSGHLLHPSLPHKLLPYLVLYIPWSWLLLPKLLKSYR